jgi:hypothetical protein
VVVVLDETTNECDLLGLLNGRELNHLLVDLLLEVLVDVENVCDTSRHTSGEVATGRPEDKDTTTSHVLATVVTDTLNDGCGSGVTDTETLRSDTTEEAGTLGSTVQADVTDQDILLGTVDGSAWRVDDQATT